MHVAVQDLIVRGDGPDEVSDNLNKSPIHNIIGPRGHPIIYLHERARPGWLFRVSTISRPA